MRTVVQRVRSSTVTVDGAEVGRIESGLCCLVGVETDDMLSDIEYTAGKICGLRIFDDPHGKMNLTVADIGGEILIVSQFTLLGDARQGRRLPSAARPLWTWFQSTPPRGGRRTDAGI